MAHGIIKQELADNTKILAIFIMVQLALRLEFLPPFFYVLPDGRSHNRGMENQSMDTGMVPLLLGMILMINSGLNAE